MRVHRLAIVVLLALVGGATLAACGTSASTAPTSAPGLADHPLVGSWTVEITRPDLQAAGFSDPGLLNENSGRFTWTLAPDGSWSQVQESLDGAPIANPVLRGTYMVEGATLVAKTVFPPEYADSGLHFAWTLAGDELRFDLLDPPDPILPILVESHPWIRVR